MQSPNIRYLPALDHVRGYAATLVLLYHSLHLYSYDQLFHKPFEPDAWIRASNPLEALLIEGHTAVALFMVLSGFLFEHGAAGRRVQYFSFMRNRLLRIYPLYLILCAAGIFFYPSRFTVSGLVRTLLFQANIPGALHLGSFTTMFWAISVEFHFYLLFPLLHRALARRGVRKVLVLVLFMISIRAAGYFFVSNVNELAYSSLLGRLDQFLIGMAGAQVFAAWGEDFQRRARQMLLPMIFVCCAALFLYNRLGGHPAAAFWKVFWPTTEGLLWAGFLICYIASFNSLGSLPSRLLARLGVVSYSYYLIHAIVIYTSIGRRAYLDFGLSPYKSAVLNGLLFVAPLVTALAALCYGAIERPFLRFRGRYLVD